MHSGYCKCRVDGEKDWNADASGAFEVGVLGQEIQGFKALRELSRYQQGPAARRYSIGNYICPLEVNVQISSLKNFNS